MATLGSTHRVREDAPDELKKKLTLLGASPFAPFIGSQMPCLSAARTNLYHRNPPLKRHGCVAPSLCAPLLSCSPASEGDRKAYYEHSQATIKSNKDAIAKLKKENKQLTQQLKELKVGCTFSHL